MSEQSEGVVVEKHGKKNHRITMKKVERIAESTIKKHSKLKLSRDNVDFVMNAIWRAYVSYDESKSNLMSWLVCNARYGVQNLFNKINKEKKKKPMLSLDKEFAGKHGNYTLHNILGETPVDSLIIKEIVDFIDQTDNFNEKQRHVVKRYYLESTSIADISRETGLNRTYIYFLLRGAISKLRYKFGATLE